MFRTLEESGGLNDNVNRQVGTKKYDTGAVQIAYDLIPWSHYAMPYPDCDNDNGTMDKHVLSEQKCGDRNLYGRRWGQCDQWRSSCQDWVEEALATVGLAVEGVTEAAKPGPNAPTVCAFSQMYSDAMGLINYWVGSTDPILGQSFPEPGSEAYIPRWRSALFGGAAFHSNAPYYTAPHTGEADPYYSQKRWETLLPSMRQVISNGEFCRGVITQTYPGKNAVQYPDLIGGCMKGGFLGTCARYQCKHLPLEGWDLAFHDLRLELISAVALYEKTHASELKGQTIDQYCAVQTAALAVNAPDVIVGGVDADQYAYALQVEGEKKQALAESQEAELVNELLAGGGGGAAAVTPILLAGGALIAGIFAFSALRRR